MSYNTEPTYHLSDDVDPVLGMAAMRYAVLMRNTHVEPLIDRVIDVRDASAVMALRDPVVKERRRLVRVNVRERFGMPFMEFALTVHDERWAVTLLSNGVLVRLLSFCWVAFSATSPNWNVISSWLGFRDERYCFG